MSAIDTLESACDADLEACLASAEEVKQLMENEPKKHEKELINAIGACEAAVTKVKKSRKNVGLELTQIKDRNIRNEKAAKVKYYDEQIQLVTTMLQKAKSVQTRLELMKDAKPVQNSTEGKSNDELLDSTNKIQDLTFESLGRTKMLIEQTKEVGSATIEELQRQRVQMHDIEEDIDVLESHVQRAEKLVVNFARRMASDKIIQFFMVFNIVIIIIVAIYAGVTGKSLTGSSNHSQDNFFGTHYPTSMPSTYMPTS